jgi:hypothetical protein
MTRIAINKDFVGGVFLVIIAALFIGFGSRLRVGSPVHMGPGFVPMCISLLLVIIGSVKIGLSFRAATDEDSPVAKLRPLFFVALAPAIFGVLIGPLGLIASVVIVAVFCRFAMEGAFSFSTVVIAVVLSAFCAIVFVAMLGQALPLWPRWM